MTSIRTIANDGDDALDVTAERLVGEGLTPTEIVVVMRGETLLATREAHDRWAMLRRERGTCP